MLGRRWIGTALVGLLACSSERKKAEPVVLQAKLDSTQARLDSLSRADQQRVADSIRREQTTPRRLVLLGDTVRVPPAGGQSLGFTPLGFSLASRGNCKLTGRIEVVSGGNKDLQIILFRHDDFINWKNNPRGSGQAVFSGGPQTITALDVAVPDSGTYYLVLSNRFSAFTSKTSTGSADVVCIGSPVPVAAKVE